MSDFAASTNPLIRSQDTPPIPLKTNLPIIHTALAKNADARIVEFSGLDHLLQPTSSGLPAEYRAFELALSQLTSACRGCVDTRGHHQLFNEQPPLEKRWLKNSLLYPGITMPLLRFDVLEGRSAEQITSLLDAAHRAVLSAFGVPARDRYQIVHQHAASHFVVQDTGLDITRTDSVVIVSVTSRPRTREEKEKFYLELCRELKNSCGIEPSDVMVNIVSNADEDWSFGHGRAQFLTGEL